MCSVFSPVEAVYIFLHIGQKETCLLLRAVTCLGAPFLNYGVKYMHILNVDLIK